MRYTYTSNQTDYKDPLCDAHLGWISGPVNVPFQSSVDYNIRVLQELLNQQAKEIELLRNAHHKGVMIETVKALRCPCCNAPIQFDTTRPYILKEKNIRKRCDYCGCLLEFLTKE